LSGWRDAVDVLRVNRWRRDMKDCEQPRYAPGGDAKVIREIANRVFGSYEKMFADHDWPERGSNMMRKVQTRVKETYRSVRAFEKRYAAS
jgi:hypothetical protein